MQLIVLASGQGQRLKNLTKDKPKCFVNINNFKIIDYIEKNFLLFNEVIIVGGYKYKLLKKKFQKEKVIFNKDFLTTNMVHSLFKAKKHIKEDIIVSYSDIIYSQQIIKKMYGIKKTHIPINKNWLKIWSKRMKKNEIFNDAETLEIDKNKIISIGQKLSTKLPKYQFMGLIKIKYKDFLKLYKFYKSLKNKKIDMTKFLNLAIKDEIINLSYFTTNKFWFEIDTLGDKKTIEKSFFYKKKLISLIK